MHNGFLPQGVLLYDGLTPNNVLLPHPHDGLLPPHDGSLPHDYLLPHDGLLHHDGLLYHDGLLPHDGVPQ